MQMLMHITNQPESASLIMTKLFEQGIGGATSIDCKGMLATIDECCVEPPPIFGSLRHFINPDRKSGKIILVVLKDEDVPMVKEIIHGVSGNPKLPNTGILFTVPIMGWEGVSHK